MEEASVRGLFEREAQPFELRVVVGCLPVLQEAPVAGMGAEDAARVLDRTEVLLGTRRYFARISQQSIRVGAEGAVEPLEGVQVCEVLPVNSDVIRTPDLGDLIDRKADGLVQRDAQIEEQKGNDQAVDDGSDRKSVV